MNRNQIATFIGFLLLSSGCSFLYGANISILQPEAAPAFSQQEQDTARAIAVEVGRRAGLWETDAAQKLSAQPSSSPYLHFVSLGAPGGDDVDLRSVKILGAMRKDRREILISVGDDARGEPLPATRKMIEDLRAELERAFKESRVEFSDRRVRRGFAP